MGKHLADIFGGVTPTMKNYKKKAVHLFSTSSIHSDSGGSGRSPSKRYNKGDNGAETDTGLPCEPFPSTSIFSDSEIVMKKRLSQGGWDPRTSKVAKPHSAVFSSETEGEGDFDTTTTKSNHTEIIPGKAPEFETEMRNVEVIVGENALFAVTVTGIPRPKVSWYFNKQKVETYES